MINYLIYAIECFLVLYVIYSAIRALIYKVYN